MSLDAASSPDAFVACPQHPQTPAAYVCARCGAAVCIECCYSMPDGSICCKACYEVPGEPAAASGAPAPAVRLAVRTPPVEAVRPATLPPGAGCVQHPNVLPVAFCKLCGTGSCATCDFVFPGQVHLCPVCAASAHTRLSPRRKKYLITAWVLAGWSTLALLVLLTGALAGLAEDEVSQSVLGIVIILTMGFPAIVGTAMGMSALRPGAANPISVWIALVWNALVLGALILLSIIGNLME